MSTEEGPGAGRILGRDAMLGADDLVVKPVAVPEWGGSVYVRVMSGRARDAFDRVITKGDGDEMPPDYRAELVVACACDAKGNLIFTRQDVEALTVKSSLALNPICRRAAEINGLSVSDVDDLEKNSESVRSD